MKIDLVIAYVNNQDVVWRNTYIDYCKTHNLNNKIVDLLGCRYGGINYIDYHLKLAHKNMPWLNKIYLLVSNIEQVIPSLLPPNVEIVLHKDFIPKQFLPTFNSTTIEMFLWNIPNLSEHFIYANDDMLPVGKLSPSDFFQHDKIKINWRERTFSQGVNGYGYQCYNNCLSVAKALMMSWTPNRIFLPEHSYTPMIKSHCVEIYNLVKRFVEPHIRAFRTQYQHNQYIYPLYEELKYGTLRTDIDFLYTETDEEIDINHQIICVNLEHNKVFIKKFISELDKLCE